ncbi:MAG: TonB-dependent receptor [Proteobacteria bacterium]|nr:TonB-dependent receptor [Pseudomonadota bacterium]
MFHDDRTMSQIAPSGIFAYRRYDIPCDGGNPLVSAAWLNDCASIAGPHRPLLQPTRHRSTWLAAMLRAVVARTTFVTRPIVAYWASRVTSGTRTGTTTFRRLTAPSYSRKPTLTTSRRGRSARAMDVIVDPTSGLPACRSAVDGTDPNCVPYDIWRIGGVTPAALDYLTIPLFSKGDTELKTVNVSLASDLGNYGIKLPTAEDGIGVAFGAGYYENSLDFKTDPNFESGDGAGQGGPTIGQSGGYNATELFAEVRVPIMQNMFMADSLTLNASYRFSDYSDPIDESTNTYGIGLEWSPISDIKLRGSFQHAVRAPSIIELYSAQSLGLYDNDADPCAGAPDANGVVSGGATLAQCANTGVTAAQYGGIEGNAAGQYNALFSGSTDLIPETADSYTIGFVLQPQFLPGFSLTVDYFDISVEDVISLDAADRVAESVLPDGRSAVLQP